MVDIEFPQFRKLSNDKSWFRIDSPDELTEIQIIGTSYTVHKLKAKILPERNLISDVLEMEEERWRKVTADEFENFMKDCEAKLRRVEF